ncbi:universal stress protein [Candidatus Nitrosocosmicus arcticus]|uniref:Nucleotide-binding protein UspA family n=1 Tax=Candidatus Nitrosocosmicus arcticus TaxID=2035267 RepID=A0A557SSW4_9ARCH|nr:universal stress protein [Candidatus Nitrosocosmicus arcticus]TVP39680.1 Nucleotide-binding protein UspA family [Candidatus Nitrosocosmicus arcticus]
MKILALVDGSEHSLKALDYLIQLLNQFGSSQNTSKNNTKNNPEIIILNVLPTFHTPSGIKTEIKSIKDNKSISLDEYTNKVKETIKTEWIKNLEELKTKYEKTGFRTRTKILKGSHSSRYIAYSIIKFVDDQRVDLIVLGSVGLGGISKNRALGSVTRNLAEISTCPVLIVP